VRARADPGPDDLRRLGGEPDEAHTIGISLEEQRTAFEEDVDAQTQFAPFSDFDITVAAIASPTGPRAAAKNGIHLVAPHFRAAGRTFDERVAWVNETGLGVIGTPDEAIAQIERLERQSAGFGSYPLMHHEWARHDVTLKSYELFANHVKPRFQSSTDRLANSRDYAMSRWAELDKRSGDAIAAATERHAKERAGRQ
jgi:hypothetical protein